MTSSYLELNWLAKADKYILLPPVVFADVPSGGYFYPPRKKEILIGNIYYPANKGVLIINDEKSEKIESTIAHEWRHLWQCYQGWKNYSSKWDINSPFSYKKQIINYFNSDPLEYDALLFELKKAPCDTCLEWYEWIIKSREKTKK